MSGALLASEIAGLLVVFIALCVLGLTWVRYRAIAHHRMTALCAYAYVEERPTPWRHGVLRYGGANVNVFTLSGLSRTPVLQWPWRELELGAPVDVQGPGGLESDDVVVLPARHHGRDLRLALSRQTYLALRAWLESAPPGTVTTS